MPRFGMFEAHHPDCHKSPTPYSVLREKVRLKICATYDDKNQMSDEAEEFLVNAIMTAIDEYREIVATSMDNEMYHPEGDVGAAPMQRKFHNDGIRRCQTIIRRT